MPSVRGIAALAVMASRFFDPWPAGKKDASRALQLALRDQPHRWNALPHSWVRVYEKTAASVAFTLESVGMSFWKWNLGF